MDSIRVMVFYDGDFFKKGQLYFRYKEKRGWFSLPQLHDFFEAYVAAKCKAPTDVVKVVAAHYYDGRMTTDAAAADQLEKDRKFEMALMEAGIVTHYLPLSEKKIEGTDEEEAKYRLAQKGVDIELAIDVLDAAHEDRYDVAILLTGDGDFVPLVRRITSLNRHALVAHFDFDSWVDDRRVQHRPTRAAPSLVAAASWSLDFNRLVKDPDWKSDVRNLFFVPKGAYAQKRAMVGSVS